MDTRLLDSLVFPAESSPSIRTRISLLPNRRLNTLPIAILWPPEIDEVGWGGWGCESRAPRHRANGDVSQGGKAVLIEHAGSVGTRKGWLTFRSRRKYTRQLPLPHFQRSSQ